MKIIASFLTATALLLSITGFAQEPPPGRENMEKIESFKVGFLTSRMDLSPEEAQKFWPVYNSFQDKMKGIHRGLRHYDRTVRDNYSELSDKEIEKLVDEHIANRAAEAELLKEFHIQLKKILPIRKVGKYYHAEHEFKAELVRRLREHRGERGRPDRPHPR